MKKLKGLLLIPFLIGIFPLFLISQVQVGDDLLAEAAEDEFGSAVAISSDGSTVAVSGPDNAVGGNGWGHVRVYDWQNGAWEQKGEDLDGKPGDKLGVSISLSEDGQRIAVGAPSNQDNGAFSGQVRIYQWHNGEWSRLGNSIDGERNEDQAGTSVALSADGNRVAIGSPYNDNNGIHSGHVRVFQYDMLTRSWIQMGDDLGGEGAEEFAGTSVDISESGDFVAVGSLGDGDQGKVAVFNWDNNAWTKLGETIEGETGAIQLGASLSIAEKGPRIAIGVPFFPFPGQVRVFDYSPEGWEMVGKELEGENTLAKFGLSVSLSSDGNRLVVGSPGTSFSGSASVYDYNNQNWEQIGDVIDGDLAGDDFGTAVAIAPEGNRVIVGAPKNDGSGNNSGQAKVFEFSTSSSVDVLGESEWRLYPNPTSGPLFLEEINAKVVEIFNLKGEKLWHLERESNSFNISHLPSGLYFVKVHSDTHTGVKKVLKLKRH